MGGGGHCPFTPIMGRIRPSGAAFTHVRFQFKVKRIPEGGAGVAYGGGVEVLVVEELVVATLVAEELDATINELEVDDVEATELVDELGTRLVVEIRDEVVEEAVDVEPMLAAELLDGDAVAEESPELLLGIGGGTGPATAKI